MKQQEALIYDDNLEELARTLANEYASRKRKKLGEKYRPSIFKPEVWIPIAKAVSKIEADASEYIQAQFEIGRYPIFPTMLLGDNARKKYERWMEIHNPNKKPKEELKKDDLIARLQHTISQLSFYFKVDSIDSYEIEQKVLTMADIWDPLAMMILHPSSEFKKAFGEGAKEILEENPQLKEVVSDLGFGLVIDYIYSREEGEV